MLNEQLGDEADDDAHNPFAMLGTDDFDAADPDLFAPFSATMERLLEQVDGLLADGQGPNVSIATKVKGQLVNLSKRYNSYASGHLAQMALAPKPQTSPSFRHHESVPPDNSRQTPFVPRPWDGRSIAPVLLSEAEQQSERTSLSYHYPHPFEAALREVEHAAEQLVAPATPRPRAAHFDVDSMRGAGDGSNGWTWIDTEAGLAAMTKALVTEVESLKLASGGGGAIAIDLEHHSLRSFQGLTCLLQLSSDSHDYIVDCLAPAVRPSLGGALGPILSDPGVVKVFHGANSDVMWLQRDFGLYVLNMFDTGQAARCGTPPLPPHARVRCPCLPAYGHRRL